MIPYGKHILEDDDIEAVVKVLRGNWLTTGPHVEEFEKSFAAYCEVGHAVAVNSGTAALHCIAAAIHAGPGDEIIVPAISFVATSNGFLYQGCTPVFADIDPKTFQIDITDVARKITPRTKAIVAMDYGGQACDYTMLKELCAKHGLYLIADACHALGGSRDGQKVGALADLTAFSFHPLKPITSGEGGMITCHDGELAARMRVFRNHGITTDYRKRQEQGTWFYEMGELGYNYRLTDFQCALGANQLKKVDRWTQTRQNIAKHYREAFAQRTKFDLLDIIPGVSHAYHLFTIIVREDSGLPSREEVFRHFRSREILVNVHYIPIYLHPYYRRRYGFTPGLCPRAEKAYTQMITLPIFPALTQDDQGLIIETLTEAFGGKL